MKPLRLIPLLAAIALLAACASQPGTSAPVTHSDGSTRMPVTGVDGQIEIVAAA